MEPPIPLPPHRASRIGGATLLGPGSGISTDTGLGTKQDPLPHVVCRSGPLELGRQLEGGCLGIRVIHADP